MINNLRLKICKIDSLEFASFVMKQNADFLGVHVLDKQDIGEHLELVSEIKNGSGKSVIVTKIQNFSVLTSLIELYNPFGLQLHYEPIPELAISIKKKFPNLSIFGVLTNQTVNPNFSEMDNGFDYFIYDTTYEGGSGTTNDYRHLTKFPNTLRDKTLLAGGVTVERLPELIKKGASGFDIQSYFRDTCGLNFRNLENIADQLKFPRSRKISISLTDLPLTKVYQASNYPLSNHLEYHIDYSEGNLYTTFNTIRNSIDEKRHFLQSLPHSLHIFMNGEANIESKIKKITSKNYNTLTKIFVQYYPGLQVKRLNTQRPDIKIIFSVYYKDLGQFILDFPECPKFLSIIVPTTDKPANLNAFVSFFKANSTYFEKSEIWLDRNLDLSYIKFLNTELGENFNYIIGKEVISEWSKIDEIHEYLFK